MYRDLRVKKVVDQTGDCPGKRGERIERVPPDWQEYEIQAKNTKQQTKPFTPAEVETPLSPIEIGQWLLSKLIAGDPPAQPRAHTNAAR